MIVISGLLLASGYDLVPLDFSNLALEINDQPWRPRDLAWTFRNDFDTYYDRTPTTTFRVNRYPRAQLDLYYDAGDGNIFTKERLQKIRNVEDSLTSVSEFQTKYCHLNSSLTGCQKPLSVIRYFDGTFSSVNAVFDDENFDNIVAVLYEAYTNIATKESFQFFLGKSHEITPTRAYSTITRSIIHVGYPLEGFSDKEDYEKFMTSYSVEHFKPILVHVRENYDEFDFSYRSNMLWLDDVFKQALKDAMFALGSICFIFTLILIHTQSLWIAGFAIFSIMSCFGISNLIYRIVLDYRYIGFFHVATLFVGIGIGADDIFVFYDVWRNTACKEYRSLAHRLSDCYRKTAFNILFTSLTTSVAFFASAISPLLATRSFGVSSGIVIIVNYLSVIIYFPTVIIIYHLRFERFKWPCITFCQIQCREKCSFCKREKTDIPSVKKRKESSSKLKFVDKICSVLDSLTSNDIHSNNKSEKAGIVNKNMHNSVAENRNSLTSQISIINTDIDARSEETRNEFVKTNKEVDKCARIHISVKSATDKQEVDDRKTAPEKVKKKSYMVRFFRNKYSKIVTHKILRFVILAIMATVLIFFTVYASKIEPDDEGVSLI